MIKNAIKCNLVKVGDTYSLLLCGHKGLKAGGYAESKLMNEGGLRLAVDLHPHTRFEGRVLCKGTTEKGSEKAFQAFKEKMMCRDRMEKHPSKKNNNNKTTC